MSRTDNLLCIDVEASSYPLPGSYPIEIAVAYVESGQCLTWLIQPRLRWLQHGYWDLEAERLHGITRGQLMAEGLPVEDVQWELTYAVAGYCCLSDAVTADTSWLSTLYDGWQPPLLIEPITNYLRPTDGPTGLAARERFLSAEAEAKRRYPKEHRAGPDARRWCEVLRILAGLA